MRLHIATSSLILLAIIFEVEASYLKKVSFQKFYRLVSRLWSSVLRLFINSCLLPLHARRTTVHAYVVVTERERETQWLPNKHKFSRPRLVVSAACREVMRSSEPQSRRCGRPAP